MATEQLTIIYNGGCRAKDVRNHSKHVFPPMCVRSCIYAGTVVYSHIFLSILIFSQVVVRGGEFMGVNYPNAFFKKAKRIL